MDAIDRKILAVLQENASLSVAEIGSRVGLSSTPCWKRIQLFQVWTASHPQAWRWVEQSRIGMAATYSVSIETKRSSRTIGLSAFAKVVGAMPEVMESDRGNGRRRRLACCAS